MSLLLNGQCSALLKMLMFCLEIIIIYGIKIYFPLALIF